jgi:thiol-disulfide isomerase/thioredoxin
MGRRMQDLTDVAMVSGLFFEVIMKNEPQSDRCIQDQNKSCDLFYFHSAFIPFEIIFCQINDMLAYIMFDMKVPAALVFAIVILSCASTVPLDRLNDAQIQALSSSDHPVLLHFWATWCEPCRTEIPELNRLQKKYQAVQFVAINLDDVENQGAIAPFLKKYPIEFKVVLRSGQDFQNMAQSLDPSWKGGVPATFMFKNGQRIFSKIGMVDPKELEDKLEAASKS